MPFHLLFYTFVLLIPCALHAMEINSIPREEQCLQEEQVEREERCKEVLYQFVPYDVRASDLAGGISQEKLRNLLKYFEKPTDFTRLGLKEAPRGLLLHGPSGTRKTTLAHVICSETRRPMAHVYSSSFITSYQGSGAEGVRKLFQEAHNKGIPVIIFIDEVDGIAHTDSSGSEKEANRAAYALLNGMDKKNPNIFVIVATNRIEKLPEPLVDRLRNGTIFVGLPNEAQRGAIIQQNAPPQDVLSISPDFFAKLARETEDLSFRGIQDLMEGAKIFAGQRGSLAKVTEEDFIVALYSVQRTKLPDAQARLVLLTHYLRINKPSFGPEIPQEIREKYFDRYASQEVFFLMGTQQEIGSAQEARKLALTALRKLREEYVINDEATKIAKDKIQKRLAEERLLVFARLYNCVLAEEKREHLEQLELETVDEKHARQALKIVINYIKRVNEENFEKQKCLELDERAKKWEAQKKNWSTFFIGMVQWMLPLKCETERKKKIAAADLAKLRRTHAADARRRAIVSARMEENHVVLGAGELTAIHAEAQKLAASHAAEAEVKALTTLNAGDYASQYLRLCKKDNEQYFLRDLIGQLDGWQTEKIEQTVFNAYSNSETVKSVGLLTPSDMQLAYALQVPESKLDLEKRMCLIKHCFKIDGHAEVSDAFIKTFCGLLHKESSQAIKKIIASARDRAVIRGSHNISEDDCHIAMCEVQPAFLLEPAHRKKVIQYLLEQFKRNYPIDVSDPIVPQQKESSLCSFGFSKTLPVYSEEQKREFFICELLLISSNLMVKEINDLLNKAAELSKRDNREKLTIKDFYHGYHLMKKDFDLREEQYQNLKRAILQYCLLNKPHAIDGDFAQLFAEKTWKEPIHSTQIEIITAFAMELAIKEKPLRPKITTTHLYDAAKKHGHGVCYAFTNPVHLESAAKNTIPIVGPLIAQVIVGNITNASTNGQTTGTR